MGKTGGSQCISMRTLHSTVGKLYLWRRNDKYLLDTKTEENVK